MDYRKYSGNYLHKDLAIGNHSFSVTATDLAGKATTQTFPFTVTNRYQPVFASEKLYLPFGPNGDFKDIINLVAPSIVGSPSTNATAGRKGAAYQGATDGYISFPLAGLYSSQGISFCFWYKVNASPDRSGIVTINDNANDADDNRMQGLRLFREGSASSQRIKANVGTGTADSWNDGDVIDPSAGKWVHIAATISPTESKIYFDGVLKRTSTYSSFSFSTSTTMVIGSGAPSFAYWNHKSDLSLIDDFRVFNTALTPADIQLVMQQ